MPPDKYKFLILESLGWLTHSIGDRRRRRRAGSDWSLSCERGIGEAHTWEYANKSFPKKQTSVAFTTNQTCTKGKYVLLLSTNPWQLPTWCLAIKSLNHYFWALQQWMCTSWSQLLNVSGTSIFISSKYHNGENVMIQLGVHRNPVYDSKQKGYRFDSCRMWK